MKLFIFVGKKLFRTYSNARLSSKIVGTTLVFTFGAGIFFVHFYSASKSAQNLQENTEKTVLGAQTQKLIGSFNVNIPSFFNSNLYLKGDLLVNGQASVSGNLTAPNILYALNAGNGITVSGGQNPVIENSGVTSIGGQTGAIKLSSGQGITVDGLNLVNSDPGSAQNIFKTIKIGSDAFSAGNNNDTLTFSAGNGISISPDADNKTITISNTTQSQQTGWSLNGTSITPVDTSYLVGIGTSAPTEKLDVNGNIKVSGTTSFNNVAYTWPTTAGSSGYLLQSDGAGGLTWAPITGGGNVTTGGGTSSFIPKFTSTFGLGNSSISDNGSLVNIGENFKVTGSSITFSSFTTGIAQFSSSGVLTSNALNLSGGSNYITGTLPVSNGGTGAVNANAARLNLSAASSGANSDITALSGLTTALSVPQGGTGLTSIPLNQLVYGNGTSALQTTAVGSSGQVLAVDSSGTPTWQTLPGVGGGLCTTCVVTNPAANQIISPTGDTTGLSVAQTNASSPTANIFSVTDNAGTTKYLQVSANGDLTFGGSVTVNNLSTGVIQSNSSGLLASSALNLSGGSNYITGTLPVSNGGTGNATFTANGVLVGNGTNGIISTAIGNPYAILRVPSGGGAPAFGAIDLSQSQAVSNALGVANGGTGKSNYTAGDILYANTNSSFASIPIGDNGQFLSIAGGVPTWITSSSLTYFQETNGALSPIHTTDSLNIGATATSSALAHFGGTAGDNSFVNNGSFIVGATAPTGSETFRVNGTSRLEGDTVISGNLTGLTGLSSSGTITFSGLTTNGGLLYTNGTGVLAQTAQGTSTQCLTGGSTPTWTDCASAAGTTSYWDLSNGALYASNPSTDFLIGGSSTASAKFAVKNVANGTPTAVLQGQNGSIYFTADGTLATTNSQNLTLGSGTTGNIVVNGLGNGIVKSTSGVLGLATAGTDYENPLTFSTGLNRTGNTITNTGVLSNLAGTGIGVSGSTGNVTISNTGVLSFQGSTGAVTLTSGSGIGISGTTISNTGILAINGTANQITANTVSGTTTLSLPQNIATTSTPTFGGLTLSSLTSGIAHLSSSGVISSGKVDLTSEVTGLLPVTNGGTGANNANGARINLSAAKSGANSDITQLSGLTTALSTGQGGTGATGIGSAGSIAYSNGSSYAFSDAGNSGQLLVSSGTGAPTWINASAVGTNYFQLNSGVVSPLDIANDFAVGGASTSSALFQVSGTTGQVTTNLSTGIVKSTGGVLGLATAGTDYENPLTFSTGLNRTGNTITNTGVLSNIAGTGIGVSGATGNVTISNTGVLSLTGTANQITASGSTGNITLSLPQNIATTSTPTFGGLTLTGTSGVLYSNGGTINSESKLAISRGGTNSTTTPTQGGIAYGDGSAYQFTTAGTSGQVLKSNGTSAPAWVDASTLGTNYFQLNSGVISAKDIADDFAVGGNSTSSALFQVSGTTGQVTTNLSSGIVKSTSGILGLATAGTDYESPLTFSTGLNRSGNTITNTGVLSNIAGTGIGVSNSSGNVTISNTGVLSLTGTANQITASGSTGNITLSLPQNIATTSTPTFGGLTLSNLTSGEFVRTTTGGELTSEQYIDLASQVSGKLPIANGGTNSTATPTQGGIAYGDGSAYQFTTAGTAGQVLKSNGTSAPTWVDASTLGTNYFQLNSGVISPVDIANDLAVGGTSTSSALFQVSGTTGNIKATGTLTGLTGLSSSGTITFSGLGSGIIKSTSGTLSLAAAGTDYQAPLTAGVDYEVPLTFNTGLSRSGDTITNTGVISLTGTSHQVNVSGSTGDVTLSLPQSIDTTSSPTFSGLTLSSLTHGGGVLYTNGSGVFAQTATGTSGQVLKSNGTSAPTWVDAATLGTNYFQLNSGVISPKDISNDFAIGGASTSSALFQVSGTTGQVTTNLSSGIVKSTSGVLGLATAGTDYESPLTFSTGLNRTGNTITNTGVLSVTGTANQVTASGSTGNITLSLPQNINTTSSPSFTGLTLSGFSTNGGVIYTNASGVLAQSTSGTNGQCLTTDGSGNLSFSDCLSGGSGGSGGVASLNGLSGALTLNNATATGSSITINNAKADGSTKGIAAFNSTNFSDNGSGVINTAQNINSTATPTFGSLTLTSNTNPLVLGTTNTATVTLDTLTADRTYTLPDASGTFCLTTGNCSGTGAGIGGSGTANYIPKFSAQYALEDSLIYDNGTNVGIGTTSPSSLFSVGSSSQFQVNSSGAIAAATGITSSGTVTFSGLGSGIVKSTSGVLGLATAGTDFENPLTFSTGLNRSGNTITNTGVLTNVAGDGIGVSGASGNVTISNTGVLSLAGTANQITASGSTGAITLSLPQNIATTSTPTFGGLTLSNATGNNAVVYGTSGTGVLGSATTSTNGLCLVSGASGPTWTNCAGATGINTYFQENSGAISPKNITDDLLLGDTATSSALIRLAGTANSNSFFNTGGKVGVGTTSPQNLLDVRLAGTNQGTVVGIGDVTNGTFGTLGFSTGTGLPFQVMGSGGDDLVLGANNAEVIRLTGGKVGVGTTSPSSLFSVGSSSQFQVNSSGAIAAATGITSSGTVTFSGLGSGIVKSTSGVLGLATAGTDYQAPLSAGTGVTISSNTVSIGQSVASTATPTFGGLTLSGFSTNGGLIYTNASGVLAQTTAGNSGQLLKSNGTGAPTWVDAASVGTNYFQLNSGVVSPVNISNDLAIGGTATSSALFQVSGTTGQVTTNLSSGIVKSTSGVLGLATAGTDYQTPLTAGTDYEVPLTFSTGLHRSGNTITNTGVLSFQGSTGAVTLTNGSGIGISGTTISNTGVLSLTGTANQITASGSTGNITLSLPQDIATTSTPTFGGLTLTGTSGVVYSNAGVLSSESKLAISLGGTNSTATPTQGGVAYGDGSAYQFTTAGNSGQILKSNGTSAPTWVDASSVGTNYFQVNSGVVSPVDIANDFAVGGASTSSAKFQVSGTTGSIKTALSTGLIKSTSGVLGLATAGTDYQTPLTAGTDYEVPLTFSTGLNRSGNTITNTGVLSFQGSAGAITLTNGSGIGISGTTISNTGVISNTAGNGISIDTSTGNNTITNTGVLSLTGTTNQITASGSTGNITLSLPQNIAITSTPTFGGLTLSPFTTAGGLLYTNGSGVLAQTGAGTSDQCLIGGATPSWNSCAAATGLTTYWQQANGALSPFNSTADLLIGGQATSSAIFAVTGLSNVNHQTTASVSGNLLVMPNNGYGGNVGIGTTTPNAPLDIFSTNPQLRLSYSPTVYTTVQTAHDGQLQFTSYGSNASVLYNSTFYVGAGKSIWAFDGTNNYIGLQSTGGLNLLQTDAGSTNKDISIAPANVVSTTFANGGNVGIGDTTPASLLTVGNGDLFQVNSSGAIAAATGITSSGTVTFSNYTTNGGLLYTNGSGVLAQTGAGTSNQCLTGGTTPAWGACGTIAPFQELSGAISPLNSTEDLLIGGNSTASAKFAVLNMASGTPTASLSAGITGGLSLDANGNIQTTNNQTLTIGGANSGQLVLKSMGNIVFQTSGTSNTFIGQQSGGGGALTSGQSNTGVGVSTLYSITTGLSNVAIGQNALSSNTNGGPNTAIGINTLLNNISGSSNVAIGDSALSSSNANNNVAIGSNTLQADTSGTDNSGNGFRALYTNTTGNYSTAQGAYALYSNKFGNYNSALGYFADVGSNNLSYATAIGAQAVVNTSNSLVLGGTGTAAVNVGIGTASPISPLQIEGGQMGGNAALIVDQKGVSTNDIFTASSSGTTKFTINNNGNIAATGTISGLTGLSSSGTITFSGLGSGLVKSTSGVLGLATAGTDFENPLTFSNGLIRTGNSIALGSALTSNTSIPFAGNTLTLGDNTGNGNLVVSPNAGGNAALIINKQGNNDIFTASASGTTKFTIANNGNLTATGTLSGLTGLSSSGTITFSGFSTNGGLIYTNGSGVLSQTGAGASTDCLTGGTTPTWTNCGTAAGGAPQFNLSNGAISAKNSTADLLIGGTSTGSAKFAILNINSGTPTASISSGLNGNGISMSADGTIQTPNNQTLTLGGNNTGNILLNPLNGNGQVNIQGGVLSSDTNSNLMLQAGTNLIQFLNSSNSLTSAGALKLAAGGSIDTNTTGTLSIGATNATTLTLGRSGQNITLPSLGTGLLKATSGTLSLAIAGTDYQTPLTFSTGLNLSSGTVTNTGVLSLTGTSNQVNVSGSTGNITLSLPQSIGTTSTPTFGGLTSSGTITFSGLGSGLVKSTSGVLGLATAGTDYQTPLTAGTNYEVPLTFNNGLTRNTNTISLGGTLSSNTSIALGGNNLTFTGTGDVGIGTSTPTSNLEVASDTSAVNQSLTLNNQPTIGSYFSGLNFKAKTLPGVGTWNVAYDSPTTEISTMVVDQTNDVIYAGGVTGGAIYRCVASTGCNTSGDWTTAYSTGNYVRNLVIDPTNNVIFANTSNAIYRCALSTGCSTSGNWSTSYTTSNLSISAFGIDHKDSVLYSSIVINTSYKYVIYCNISSTGCSSSGNWNSFTPPSTYLGAFGEDQTDGILYWNALGSTYRCATSSGCNATADWTTIPGGPASANAFATDGVNGVTYAGNSSGVIYRCDTSTGCNSSGNWTTSYATSESYIESLVINSATGYVYAGSGTNGIIYSCKLTSKCKSSSDWTTSYDSPASYVYSLAADNTTGYTYAGTYNAGVIYYLNATSPGLATFAQIQSQSSDNTAGAENGVLAFNTEVNGTQTEVLRLMNGNVGIGTVSPTSKLTISDSQSSTVSASIVNTNTGSTADVLSLQVGATTAGTSNYFLSFLNGNGAVVGKVQGNGSGGVTYATNGIDFAEYYKKDNSSETFEPGDIVCLGTNGGATKCGSSQSSILGVVSDRAGFVGGSDHENDSNYVLVGIIGQLPVKVTGDVKPGDMLSSSNIDGVASASGQTSFVVGRAMESHTGGTIGKVNTTISLMYVPSFTLNSNGNINGANTTQTSGITAAEIPNQTETQPTTVVNTDISNSIATISAQLSTNTQKLNSFVDQINSQNDKIASLSAQIDSLSNSPISNLSLQPFATESGQFVTVSQGLLVYGTASLNDVAVQTLSVGNKLQISDNSINVIGDTLSLQPLKQGGVDIMGGEITIDTTGNAVFKQDVAVLGALTVNSLNVTKSQISNISDTEIEASGSAGMTTIKEGQNSRTIHSPLVKDDSLIYITPIGDTDNQVLYIASQSANLFTVKVNASSSADIKFNYLIVNQK